jgi:hypothetical protein
MRCVVGLGIGEFEPGKYTAPADGEVEPARDGESSIQAVAVDGPRNSLERDRIVEPVHTSRDVVAHVGVVHVSVDSTPGPAEPLRGTATLVVVDTDYPPMD